MKLIRFCIQYPHVLFYIIAGLCLYAALVNYHSSIAVADYIETEGEICNLESKQVLWHQQYVTRYDYDIVWYDDGEKYTKHLDEQVNSRDEGPCTIWVRPDNKDALLGNSTDMREDVPIFILVGLVSGVIGFIICKVRNSKRRESRAQRIERLEDTKMYCIMIIILAVISIAMFSVIFYNEYKQDGYISSLIWDTLATIVLIIVVAFVKYFRAKKQLRRQ